MFPFGLHLDEQGRLAALHSYDILDTLEEKDFDDLSTLAAVICQVPISLISMLDEKRQWFKSHKGLDMRETPIEQSFCAHVVASHKDIMIVEDARLDDRFKDNPFVTNHPGVVFYAGVPLINEDGFPLGTLCVKDTTQHHLTTEQQEALKTLAHVVMDKLELRRKAKTLEKLNSALGTSKQQIQELHSKLETALDKVEIALDSACLGIWSKDVSDDVLTLSGRARMMYGLPEEASITYTEVKQMIDPLHRDSIVKSIAQAIENKTHFSEKYLVSPMDGSPQRWIKTYGKAYYNKQGKATYITGVVQDITEHAQQECSTK
jgi:PAS domain S-box-containing protein